MKFFNKPVSIILFITVIFLLSISSVPAQVNEIQDNISTPPTIILTPTPETEEISKDLSPTPEIEESPSIEATPVIEETESPLPAETPEGTPVSFSTLEDSSNVSAVKFLGKNIFVVSSVGELEAEERAKDISKNLEEIFYSNRGLNVDDFTLSEELAASAVVDGEKITVSGVKILYKNELLMFADSFTAEIKGETVNELAEFWLKKIKTSILDYRAKTSPTAVRNGILLSILSLIGFLLFAFLVNKIAAFSRKKCITYFKEVKFQRQTILSKKAMSNSLRFIINNVQFIVYSAGIYITITLILGFFYWTKSYGDRLAALIVNALGLIGTGILGYLPNLFVILITIYASYYIIKLIFLIFNGIDKKYITIPGFESEWAIPTFKIVRFLLIIMIVVIIFPYLPGGSSPAFQGISVFIGLLISLGSSSAVANIVAGVILIYMKAFKIGDRIKMDDVSGFVIEKTLLVTRIRTFKNVDITVPNSKILGTHISNFSTCAENQGVIVHTEISIGYDVPIDNIKKLLCEAAAETQDVLQSPPPFVLVWELGDFAITYQVNAYVGSGRHVPLSGMRENIYNKLSEEGIEIMSPTYHSIRDGNHSTIADKYLDENYTQPAFQVSRINEPGQENNVSVSAGNISIKLDNWSSEQKAKLIELINSGAK